MKHVVVRDVAPVGSVRTDVSKERVTPISG
jgi:hypothetical protein